MMNLNSDMGEMLINKIANSGLITLKPEEWVPSSDPMLFDLKDFLFKGLILKEQEFRDQLKQHNWAQYLHQSICIYCSADAIIPSWAYMLIATYASPYAKEVFFGTKAQWISHQLLTYVDHLDVSPYMDQRDIIKGCSDGVEIGPEIYLALTHKLVPVVKSLMFGEPCSTVPVYKRPREA